MELDCSVDVVGEAFYYDFSELFVPFSGEDVASVFFGYDRVHGLVLVSLPVEILIQSSGGLGAGKRPGG
ncbi:hypothetical protein AKJ40_03915 [candidate division MSBL1 archaeon SCGC-AAA259M10]|uniref:Uncharacterized protein n=1 Tax=candidate division MSBL1 archaeon SCGC-AAA259M10 TaxID=1698270 RepID=A0A133UY33_9EURY|nr:hypothetical protein AKJ40_03915 [candidate division MSBL1 archaeon SCGC-AAA259M10]